MPDIRITRDSPYTAAQMFDLVVDVDRYCEFIPYCVASHVHSRTSLPTGETRLLADLSIAYKFLRETYCSEIMATADKSEIVVRQQRGPFRHLHNRWHFVDSEQGCRIAFELTFEFAGVSLVRLIQPMIERVVARFIDSFEARAHAIYGD